jgi:phospholipid/cholesterol/gamma-HCH transport system permease protein
MTNEAAPPNLVPVKRPPKTAPALQEGAGSLINSVLTFIGEAALLIGRLIASIVRGGVDIRDLMTQMAAIGVDSIWIVLVVTTATGAVFSLYTTTLAKEVGGITQFVGGTLGYAFLNELGPVLGGVAFAARAGAAIAAEIGTMVVTEQVDALRAMAVSPTRYLVVPRVLAAVLMLPLLTLFADLFGMIGGYFLAGANGVQHAVFLDSVHKYTRTEDLTHGLIKSVIFGLIVGVVACQQGLRTKGGATGVGRSTTNSVVLCVLLIFVADFFLAQIMTGSASNR